MTKIYDYIAMDYCYNYFFAENSSHPDEVRILVALNGWLSDWPRQNILCSTWPKTLRLIEDNHQITQELQVLLARIAVFNFLFKLELQPLLRGGRQTLGQYDYLEAP